MPKGHSEAHRFDNFKKLFFKESYLQLSGDLHSLGFRPPVFFFKAISENVKGEK